jgi:hypothetical protein
MPKIAPSSPKAEKLTAADEWRRQIFTLVSDLEDPRDQALAFAHAFALMGFGLRNVGDDYGPSFLAIAEAMTGQLTAAKSTWRQIMDASAHEPSVKSRRMPKLGPAEARRRVRRKQGLGK